MSDAVTQQGKRATYPAYKPSGIDWLGEVPKHWEAKRLKHVSHCLDGKRIPLNSEQRGQMQGEYPYWGANGIVDKVNQWLFDEELVLLGEDGAPFFEKFKDVAFNVFGKIWVNNHIHVLRPIDGIEGRYLTHALNISDYIAFIEGTTRDKLTQDRMNCIPVLFPPKDEQRAIAVFLDRETSKIDKLVSKKERLIELLQEKRTALISHAVTKGLDPNVKMKPSGIDWLGEVPAQWHHRKLGHIAVMTGGSTPNKANEEYWSGIIPWVSPKDMKRRVIDDAEDHVSEEALRDTSLRLIQPPVVLIVVRGMILVHTFPVAVTTAPVTINQDMKVLKPKPGFNADYLAFLLEGISSLILSHVEESAHGTKCLRTDLWKNISVFMPEEREQGLICAHLHHQSRKLGRLVGCVKDSVEKLREYRTALISAAVTGKIDVRKETAAGKPTRKARFTPMLGSPQLKSPLNTASFRILNSQINQIRRSVQIQTEMGKGLTSLRQAHTTALAQMKIADFVSPLAKQIKLANQNWAQAIKGIQIEIGALKLSKDIHRTWRELLKPDIDIAGQLRSLTAISLPDISLNLCISASLYRTIDFSRFEKLCAFRKSEFAQMRQTFASFTTHYEELTRSIQTLSEMVRIPRFAIYGASREVLTTGYAITRLDPDLMSIPDDDQKLVVETARKDLPACEDLLQRIDPALTNLYLGAHEAFRGGGTDRARHILISLRELFDHLLRRLAPADDVIKWVPPEKQAEYLHKGKPTRKTRFLYVCRGIDYAPLSEFVLGDAKALISLMDLFNRVHEVRPNLSDEQLEALLLRTDSWLVYILQIGETTK